MDKYSFSTKQRDMMERMAKMLMLEDDEDSDFDDEDDETLAPEEDMGFDCDMDALEDFMKGSVTFSERVIEPVEQILSETVKFDRETIEEAVTSVNKPKGLVNVFAAPGSGKTRELPQLINDQQRDVVVIVPEAVIANVAADLGTRAAYQTVNEKIKGPQDLTYMTDDAFLELYDRNQLPDKNVLVMMDEMQVKNQKTRDLTSAAMACASTNRVALMSGMKPGEEIVLPDNIKCVEKIPDWRIGFFKKVLVLHSTQKEVQAAAVDARSVCIIPGHLNHNVEAFKKLKTDGYKAMHATPITALGIHFPFEAVYGVSAYEISGNLRSVTLLEHVQMAMRAGRGRGMSGTYFGKDERIRRVKLPAEFRVDKYGGERIKPAPIKKKLQKASNVKNKGENVAIKQYEKMRIQSEPLQITFKNRQDLDLKNYLVGSFVDTPVVITDEVHLEKIKKFIKRALIKPNAFDGDEILKTVAGLKNAQNECIRRYFLDGDVSERTNSKQIARFVKENHEGLKVILKRTRMKLYAYDENGDSVGQVIAIDF